MSNGFASIAGIMMLGNHRRVLVRHEGQRDTWYFFYSSAIYGPNEAFLASAEVRIWGGGRNAVALAEGTFVFLIGRFAVRQASGSVVIDAIQMTPLPDYSTDETFKLLSPALTFCGPVESTRREDGDQHFATVAVTEYMRNEYMPFHITVVIDHKNPRWKNTRTPDVGSPNSFAVTSVPLKMDVSGQFTVSPLSVTYNSSFSADVHPLPTASLDVSPPPTNGDSAVDQPAKKRKHLDNINSMAAAANARTNLQPSSGPNLPQGRGLLHVHSTEDLSDEATAPSSQASSSTLTSTASGSSEAPKGRQSPAQNTRLRTRNTANSKM
jgi:hypothetical protein